MKFVFIDEVESSQKNPKFFGLGAVIVNSNSYHIFKENFNIHFKHLGWNKDVEFKCKYLFSKSGDASVSIEKRIDFVKEIAEGCNANKNARLKCMFCCGYNGNGEDEYLKLFSCLISKIKKEGPGHKKVIGYLLDNNVKVSKKKIIDALNKHKPKDVEIFERPFFIDSDNFVPGIIAADILCYLKSWVELNPNENEAAQLFPAINENDKKKLTTVKEILSLIKKVEDVKR